MRCQRWQERWQLCLTYRDSHKWMGSFARAGYAMDQARSDCSLVHVLPVVLHGYSVWQVVSGHAFCPGVTLRYLSESGTPGLFFSLLTISDAVIRNMLVVFLGISLLGTIVSGERSREI